MPNEIENLFLGLIEKSVINIQRLENAIDNVVRGQDNLIHELKDLRHDFNRLASKVENSHVETIQKLEDIKQDINSFTRRVDVLNREILAVKSEQNEIAEQIKDL